MDEEINRSIEDCRDDLRKIKKWIDENSLHDNVRYLVSYSVIRACSVIEVAYKQMIFNFLSESARVETKNYLERHILDSSHNPRPEIILSIIEQFDSDRKIILDKAIKGTNEKGFLNSLVSLRNAIAHGKTYTSSIDDVIKYFEGGLIVLNELETALK